MKKLITNAFLLLSVFLLASIQKIQAQQNDTQNLTDLQPVAPSAFEFLKHGEIPVGHYTGIPNVSVPLYTIQTKGLQLPINLNYHSNGFRVNEEAGWTGLGWTLQTGGSVIQVVNGYDDFGKYKGRDHEAARFVEELTSSSSSSVLDCSSPTYFHVGYGQSGGSIENYPTLDYDPLLMQSQKDIKPDIFKFSFLGLQGEFVLDWKTGTFVCLNDPKIKIESGSKSGFVIRTPEGHRLTFGKAEETKIATESNLPSGGGNLMTGEVTSRNYRLESIFTNKGDIIEYTYHNLTSDIYNIPSYSTRNVIINNVRCNNISGNTFTNDSGQPWPQLGFPENQLYTNQTTTKQKQYYLKQINWDEGSIVFESTTNRVDIVGARKLNTVLVRQGSRTIKSFDFSYDYFVGTEGTPHNYTPGILIGKTATELSHRLQLLQIKESSKPAYVFDYYHPNKLYRKDTKSNHLGFVDNHSFQSGTAGLLKEITYPTGGNSTFLYESNSTSDEPVTPYMKVYGEEQYIRVNLTSTSGAQIKSINSANLSTNTNYEYTIYLNALADGPCASSALISGSNLYDIKASAVKLKRNPANGYFNQVALSETMQPTTSNNNPQKTLKGSVKEDEYLTISARMNVAEDCQTASNVAHSYADVLMKYRSYELVPNTDYYSGWGLRIKRIVTQENKNDASTQQTKEFRYKGGKSMSPYVRKTYERDLNFYGERSDGGHHTATFLSSECKYDRITYYSQSFYSPSASASGNYIGYDTVEEFVYDTANRSTFGKTVYHYKNTPDEGVLYDAPSNQTVLFNLFPLQKVYPENGSILKQEVYTKNDVLKQEINYAYNSMDNNNKCVYARASKLHDMVDESIYTYDVVNIYTVGFYPIKPQNTVVVEKTQKDLFGTDTLVSSQQYLYNNYQQIKDSYTETSTGKTIKTSFKYPHNYSEYPYNYMKANNFLTPVVEKEVFENNEKLEKQKFTYQRKYLTYDNVNRFIYPVHNYADAKGNNSLQTRIIYHNYDNKGNPKIMSRKDGTKIYYVWGYHQTQPIAKIEGYVSLSSSQTTLINDAIAASNLDTDRTVGSSGKEGTLRAKLQLLRNAFPNALVSTFTYDPLIGVTSITGPRGQTLYYHYDGYHRLQYIKDAEGNILSKNEYHYKN